MNCWPPHPSPPLQTVLTQQPTAPTSLSSCPCCCGPGQPASASGLLDQRALCSRAGPWDQGPESQTWSILSGPS
ncbi:unnamed protein product [Boreogadus saida]